MKNDTLWKWDTLFTIVIVGLKSIPHTSYEPTHGFTW